MKIIEIKEREFEKYWFTFNPLKPTHPDMVPNFFYILPTISFNKGENRFAVQVEWLNFKLMLVWRTYIKKTYWQE